MKRIIFGSMFVCFFAIADAQKMEDCFIQMPDDLLVLLDVAWKKELVDLYKSDKPAALENSMLGQSVLKKLSDHYLLLQSTERSTLELKLLPLINNTFIICMIETVYAPIADSRVSFYTTEWQQLPADSIFTPVSKDWFWKDYADQTTLSFLFQSEFLLVKYHLSDENTTLTAEYMTPLNLDEENQQNAKPFLKNEPKTYVWKNGRYE